MSVGKVRRFTTYNAVLMALKRSKFEQPGMLGTALLRLFLEFDGVLTSGRWVSEGICSKGEFTPLRKQLVEKGWLVWSSGQSYKAKYMPGKKLIPYLNREKQQSDVLVTQREMESAIAAAETRIMKVIRRIEKERPPVTEEKVSEELKLEAISANGTKRSYQGRKSKSKTA